MDTITHTTPESFIRYDGGTRTVQTLAADGTVLSTRPYTTAENAAADQRAAVEQARAEHDANRAAVRAILDTINAQLDEARAAKASVVAVLDATAPTTIAQTWAQTKALARALRDTDNALIGTAQGVKDIARLVKDS